MADYIKREDIFNVISIGRLEYPECDSVFDGMETEVRHIPSADVAEVVHGKWVNGKCSECGGDAPFWPMATTYYRSNFCPNCGARMDGGTFVMILFRLDSGTTVAISHLQEYAMSAKKD